MDADTVARAMEEAEGLYYFGLRRTERPLVVGSVLDPSRVWIDGEPTDEYLDGTSVVYVASAGVIADALSKIEQYYGDHIALVGAARERGWGEDANERILVDPVVMLAWRAR
jgi:hypothetical protein